MLKRVILYLLLIIITHDVFSQQPMDKMWGGQTSKTTEAERGQLFNSHYAMFIHWGLFSKLANRWDGKTYYGIGEWLMNSNMANIPVDEYRTVAKDFNPTMFNARQIAKLAKDAGMKYIIITAKHHDGFAMYRSQCNKFNIVDGTPFKR
ncbi:MAG: alpha-L-fucosidase, partial [Petrimonas sp.]|uniref:alpha-L-fucosidase n=1 Tax=Petrimonas sp. TaxID=2023866 RepID=UPI002B3F06A6|nr:alpha-L-fucosidase [Petrimonas sp.]